MRFIKVPIIAIAMLFGTLGLARGPKVEPEDWNTGTGTITYEGVVTTPGSSVPLLVGKNPNDVAVRKEYLDGSKFFVVGVGSVKSTSIPKGSVVSQKPKGYELVKSEGKIEVVISSGN